jgi:hypothetical protein
LDSLHLKNTPPIPLTFLYGVTTFDGFVMIPLNTNPKQNDAMIATVMTLIFFIYFLFVEYYYE